MLQKLVTNNAANTKDTAACLDMSCASEVGSRNSLTRFHTSCFMMRPAAYRGTVNLVMEWTESELNSQYQLGT